MKRLYLSVIIVTLFSSFASPAIAASKPTLDPIVQPKIAQQNAAKNTLPATKTDWSVTLTYSKQYVWPGQNVTLIANAGVDVGPTPFYISIFDRTAKQYVAICNAGTTCMTTVQYATPGTHYFEAYISRYPSSLSQPPDPSGICWVDVEYVVWQSGDVTLWPATVNLKPGEVVTLFATTSVDIGPSPYWIEIYDATLHSRIAACGSGKTCTARISQPSATTHKYIAYVTPLSTAFPPPNIISASPEQFITWTTEMQFVISLSSQTLTNTSVKLTAQVATNVAQTPYYIAIYNQKTGARLTVCSYGTTCSVIASASQGNNSYIAFVANNALAYPPTNIRSSSNVVNFFVP